MHNGLWFTTFFHSALIKRKKKDHDFSINRKTKVRNLRRPNGQFHTDPTAAAGRLAAHHVWPLERSSSTGWIQAPPRGRRGVLASVAESRGTDAASSPAVRVPVSGLGMQCSCNG